MIEGIIIKGNGGLYTVKHDGGYIDCSIRGKFRIGEITPIAGDRCIVEKTDDGKGSISQVLPRKNSLIRPKLANVDNLLIVFAAANPKPILNVVDKLTVLSEKKSIKPIIIITKADVGQAEEIGYYKNIYELAGYSVIVTSKDNPGDIEERLKEELTGKVTAVAGCSGVGKSTLLNGLFGIDYLQTGDISKKNKKGKHTTTCVELFEKFGGFVADTPGFSSLDIGEVEKDELEQLFPEIKCRLGNCRFTGCSHINEPDCMVKKALENKLISESRYNNYIEFYNILKNAKKY